MYMGYMSSLTINVQLILRSWQLNDIIISEGKKLINQLINLINCICFFLAIFIIHFIIQSIEPLNSTSDFKPPRLQTHLYYSHCPVSVWRALSQSPVFFRMPFYFG